MELLDKKAILHELVSMYDDCDGCSLKDEVINDLVDKIEAMEPIFLPDEPKEAKNE